MKDRKATVDNCFGRLPGRASPKHHLLYKEVQFRGDARHWTNEVHVRVWTHSATLHWPNVGSSPRHRSNSWANLEDIILVHQHQVKQAAAVANQRDIESQRDVTV